MIIHYQSLLKYLSIFIFNEYKNYNEFLMNTRILKLKILAIIRNGLTLKAVLRLSGSYMSDLPSICWDTLISVTYPELFWADQCGTKCHYINMKCFPPSRWEFKGGIVGRLNRVQVPSSWKSVTTKTVYYENEMKFWMKF